MTEVNPKPLLAKGRRQIDHGFYLVSVLYENSKFQTRILTFADEDQRTATEKARDFVQAASKHLDVGERLLLQEAFIPGQARAEIERASHPEMMWGGRNAL